MRVGLHGITVMTCAIRLTKSEYKCSCWEEPDFLEAK